MNGRTKNPYSRYLNWFVPFLVFALSSCSEESPTSTFVADGTIRELLQERIDLGQNAAIVVGLLEPDGSTRVISVGESADSVFEIGSVTKVFTSVLLADMVERGELSLNDPLSELLPAEQVQVPSRNGKEITLLDVVTHYSGLPRMPTNFAPADPLNPYADYTVDQMYTFVSGYELQRDPGAMAEYSNLAMGLLGHALALRSEMSYEELLTERVLGPLEMTDSAIILNSELQARLAQGHNGFGEPTPNWELPTLAGAGAIRSTAKDMLRFAAANLSDVDTPIHRALRATQKPQRTFREDTDIAMNWIVMEPDTVQVTWHNGGTGGYRSFLGLDLAGHRAAVVLTNTSISVDDIGFHLLDPGSELAKPMAGVAIAKAYRNGGVSVGIDRARDIMSESGDWRFGEQDLNQLAYQLVSEEAFDEAIAMLRLNSEFFPDHFNPYDSLGEVYLLKGERELAIENYRKSLELNPENDNAVQRLNELGTVP